MKECRICRAGLTIVEVVVVAVIVAVLAAVAIPVYVNYVEGAKVDAARSTCEMIGAAVAQTHNRGLDITANDWSDLSISQPHSDHWNFAFDGLAASSALTTSYAITATSTGSMGTYVLKPAENGSARWVKQ
jgi:type IV pilus assembly protein PilA